MFRVSMAVLAFWEAGPKNRAWASTDLVLCLTCMCMRMNLTCTVVNATGIVKGRMCTDPTHKYHQMFSALAGGFIVGHKKCLGA